MRLGGPESTFVVAEWQDGGETTRERPIAGLHVHREEDEAWYVLEGRLGVLVGDEVVEAGPGEGVLVPRGTPHTYWNAVPARTRYLIVMGPRTAQLVAEIHEPGATDFAALFERHGSELLT
jgi:mannose-6-phosphate isomerase-like protein (cupin superfamily)